MDFAELRATTDALDCFNDDLVFIIDKLVGRVGGSSGVLTRYVHAESVGEELARIGGEHAALEALTSDTDTADFAFSAQHRRRDDDSQMRQFGWTASGADLRVLQLAFSPTNNVHLVASIWRAGSERPYGPIELITAAKLYPVLSRYIRLWWLHRTERCRADSLSAALNLADVGVILLDCRVEVVFANTRAASILERRDGLRLSGRSVAATDVRDGVRFQAAIQHGLHCNLAPGDGSEGQQSAPILALTRPGDARSLIAAVMNVERAAVDPRDAAVIIYIFDPAQDVEQMLGPVCRIYGLSNAEERLVLLLVNGLRIIDAAEKMRVQPDTARAYLKQVFFKTRTNRQVDLVRLMLASMLRTSAMDRSPAPPICG